MNLSGHSELPGKPEEIFERLFDRDLIMRCIDGCKRLELIAPNRYEITASAGVGAFQSTFDGVVEFSDVVAPQSYSITASGKSKLGKAQGTASVRLVACENGTQIHYEGQAKVSGMLAAIGGRMIDLTAKKAVQEFFDRLAREIASSA